MFKPVVFIPRQELTIPRFVESEAALREMFSDMSLFRQNPYDDTLKQFLCNRFPVSASWEEYNDGNGGVFKYIDKTGAPIPVATIDETGSAISKLDTDGTVVHPGEQHVFIYGINVGDVQQAFVRWGFATTALEEIDTETAFYNSYAPSSVRMDR